MSFKEIDPRKTLILLKKTWYLDPRIIKLCFCNSALTYSEATVQICYAKKLLLKFSENSQESICGGKLFQNSFSTEHLQTAAFRYRYRKKMFSYLKTRKQSQFSWCYDNDLFLFLTLGATYFKEHFPEASSKKTEQTETFLQSRLNLTKTMTYIYNKKE